MCCMIISRIQEPRHTPPTEKIITIPRLEAFRTFWNFRSKVVGSSCASRFSERLMNQTSAR